MSVVTGGVLKTINGIQMYEFTGSNTITFPQDTKTTAFIVAGGGGGGGGYKTDAGGGGGGGGGVGFGILNFTKNVQYTIIVGNGGAGGPGSPANPYYASSGSNSSITGTNINEVAYGGGAGSIDYGSPEGAGMPGGSGGGTSGGRSGGISTKGAGTLTYYGNNGSSSGGGGGAGTTVNDGNGGDGYLWNVTNQYYAAGGGYGGFRGFNLGNGGLGGGGNAGSPGQGYGSGGGGGSKWGGANSSTGGGGSSGVVYIVKVFLGTIPSIIGITYTTSYQFSLNFTQSINGYPAPSTYYYSLDGGKNYTNANTVESPILTSKVETGVQYNIQIIANNWAGNTAASTMVIGFIPYPCFLQGTKILRMNPETDDEEYVTVESLRKGDLIKTFNHGYKAIELIGSRGIPNPLAIGNESSKLYWFRKSRISGLREDLCVTGDHCILHKSITDEKKQQVVEHMGDIYITEDHYRVPAFLDNRSESYSESSDPVTIWHFALENPVVYHNYGVYANGLLVESSSLHFMYKHSHMKMVE